MKISGLQCPHCGGNLDKIAEGRTSLFCTYCGSQLTIEYDKNEVNDIVAIKTAQTNLNYSEEKLNYSKANLYKASAHKIEASTENMKYQDYRESTKQNQKIGVIFIVLGLFFIIASISSFFILNEDNQAFGILIIVTGITLGIGLMMIGASGFSPSSCNNREKAIKRITEIETKIHNLDDESKELRETVIECGSSIIGKKAATKKYSKQRLKEIAKEKKDLENEARELRTNYIDD